jgi:RNA polymerase sigma factor for flagellar operon FliA
MQPTATDRKRLVDANIPFVRALAARMKETLPREVEYEDLVGYGMQGLLEAAERYDERHGAIFTTFAYYRIRGAMFDGLRGMGWMPRSERARQRIEERASAYLQNLADREAGFASLEDESAPSAIKSKQEVRYLSEAIGGVATVLLTSMDAQAADEEATPQPHLILERRERDLAIKHAIGTLPEKERRLLELYYYEDKSLTEAGTVLGLSKSWTSRLHARAISLLQEAIERVGAVPDGAKPRPPPPKRR